MGFDTALFVQPPNVNLICHICMQVLENPTIVCDNGHAFCGDCINTWERCENNQNKCPDCRISMNEKFIVGVQLQSIIMGLQVKCPHKDENAEETDSKPDGTEEAESEGRVLRSTKRAKLVDPEELKAKATAATTPSACSWTGTLSSYVDKHVCSECDFCETECSKCKTSVKVSQLENHKSNECPQRRVPCCLCELKVRACKLSNHKLYHCQERSVLCSYCGAQMSFKQRGAMTPDDSGEPGGWDYTGHHTTCPQLPVPCKFASHGCHGMFPRAELDAHNNFHANAHVKLLCDALTNMKKDAGWEEAKISWPITKENIVQLENVGVISSESIALSGGNFYLQLRVNKRGTNTTNVRICLIDPKMQVEIEMTDVSFHSNGKRVASNTSLARHLLVLSAFDQSIGASFCLKNCPEGQSGYFYVRPFKESHPAFAEGNTYTTDHPVATVTAKFRFRFDKTSALVKTAASST